MTTPTDMDANLHTNAAQSPAALSAEAAPQDHCRNCNTPLLGAHCYACGQPVRGLVRPLGNLFGDFMDSVFDLDLRILRSLGPLFRRPGFLTMEYFAGRQVPYVTPVRLFFFLCILAFFVGRLTTSEDGVMVGAGGMDNTGIGAAATEPEVAKARDTELAKISAAREAISQGPGKIGAERGLQNAERAVNRTADQRLAQLRTAAAKGEPTPPPIEDTISFGGDPWDAKTNPVAVPGMPEFVNAWLNGKIKRAQENIKRLQKDPSSYKDALLGAIPTALFVLVPIFALMLKLIYLFKRRLYMEHLVVALHSHAFLSLDLLLVFACIGLQGAAPVDGVLDNLLEISTGLLLAWVPIYLLFMQKRVYGQGWPMTLLKFFVLGNCYMILLSFAITAAAVASLVWL